MRVLIVGQCSGSKDNPENVSEFDAAEIDQYDREALLERDKVQGIPARQLYTGRQQQYIDFAVDHLRESGDTVNRVYISAGFGLVDEDTELPPYDITFSDMTATEIDERAIKLGIPQNVRDAVQTDPPYDLVVLALGSDYYRACDLEEVLNALPTETTGVVFNQESLAVDRDNVISISARLAEAKEHGTIVVALKGRYLQNFAAHRSEGKRVECLEKLAQYLTTEPTTQSGLGDYQ
ncbi:hypothetical protein KTS45_11155 [Halomicroarcula limicola]|uniref:Uncharacterized protein n=1 Tax=Haloarcula limicola TaxID=1429915 RepID=A0A8J7Y644_9EURY|nr:hypothetical protein [Halomicroarcula limicola]MBV0924757.1 hypothetical protein [Halomicroarcula limicola]